MASASIRKPSGFHLVPLAAVAIAASASAASAGGFAVREQSTVFLGSAFAGSAAGGSLGSMYWNSAATAQFPGLNSESSYTLVLPYGEDHVTSAPAPFFVGGADSGNIGIDAVTSASYGSYQLSKDMWVGIALNSPFGLATQANNLNYAAGPLGLSTKLLTINANPTLAYRIAPGVTIGAGVQIEWAQAKLAFANGVPLPLNGGQASAFKGTDFAFGATAGIMIQPSRDTSIGLGYRSRLTHDLDGHFESAAAAGGYADASVDVDLPDLVTLSFRHELSRGMRLLGTVEWSNWSRFSNLVLNSTNAGGAPLTISLPANWSDGWFFALGGEYDYSPLLTLRAGGAYEISPVDEATKRFPTIPDNDRIWLNLGASYKYSEDTTIDFAYSHIFIRDGDFSRVTPLSNIPVSGTAEASVDLISVGMRTRW